MINFFFHSFKHHLHFLPLLHHTIVVLENLFIKLLNFISVFHVIIGFTFQFLIHLLDNSFEFFNFC
jgi:hypothetical protein